MPAPDTLLNPARQADFLLYRLYRIHITAGRKVVQMCEERHGMTRREWRVLSFLAENEGVLSSELAERAMLDRARTSRTITSLAGKRLIERRPKPHDRRELPREKSAGTRPTRVACILPSGDRRTQSTRVSPDGPESGGSVPWTTSISRKARSANRRNGW